ncbi:MAG: ABC transporter substrate-binding protein, partial [Deltaproteobacteria bacterium]|nr:ABC transporter substrate-binding protein [Deltaproteobacteria bacterium]
RLAVEEINRAGGVEAGQRRLKAVLVVEDNRGNPDQAVDVARKLIHKDEVAALIGPSISSNAIPAAKVAEQAGVPMISPMSTNPATTLGKRFVFRVAFIDSFQGQVMARFAREDLGARRAAVLFDVANAYNKGIAEIFKQVFEEAGGKVVAFETYTTDDNQDFSRQLERIGRARPEVLFLPNYEKDVLLQARQARQLGLEATLLGSDGWSLVLFAGLPEFAGSFYSTHWHPQAANQQAKAFIKKFKEAYDRAPTAMEATAYDALGLLFAAVKNQGRADPESIRQGLVSQGRYQGVTGAIEYVDSGDPVKSAVIVKFTKEKAVFYRLVEPREGP